MEGGRGRGCVVWTYWVIGGPAFFGGCERVVYCSSRYAGRQVQLGTVVGTVVGDWRLNMGINIELMTELGLKMGGYREDLEGIWLN